MGIDMSAVVDLDTPTLVPVEERFKNDELYYVVHPLGGGFNEDYIYDTGTPIVKRTMYAKMRLGRDVKRSHVFDNEHDMNILLDAFDYQENLPLQSMFPFTRYRTSEKEVVEKYPHFCI